MSTVMLTGATGFVGRNVARELASRSIPVRCLVRRTSNLRPLAGLPLELAYGDITDGASLEAACRDIQAVIHLVAVIRERGRATYGFINRLGTAHLVRAAQRAGVRRLLYMSNIGAGPDPAYPFLRSKWQDEEEVKGSAGEAQSRCVFDPDRSASAGAKDHRAMRVLPAPKVQPLPV